LIRSPVRVLPHLPVGRGNLTGGERLLKTGVSLAGCDAPRTSIVAQPLLGSNGRSTCAGLHQSSHFIH
jgi:hypothetical protein